MRFGHTSMNLLDECRLPGTTESQIFSVLTDSFCLVSAYNHLFTAADDIPMSVSSTEQFIELSQQSGGLAAADWLIERMRTSGSPAELFEALKLRLRLEIGLTPVAFEDEQTTEDQDTSLERGLIEACREVGTKLLAAGDLEQGWMYMRAVADLPAAAAALKNVAVTDENLDTFLILLLQEGVDPARGTRICLEQRGICNTITLLEQMVAIRGRSFQQAAVMVLVQHVHEELLQNVRNDVSQRAVKSNNKSVAPKSETIQSASPLADLLAEHPTLLQEGGYHMDTTHIASTIRFARVLDDPKSLALAIDIASYARHLHPQYQYSSEEPFEPLYPMSLAFFRTLRGDKVEAGLQTFLRKAEDLSVQEHGTIGIETYVDLLSRIGRFDEAMENLLARMPQNVRPMGVAPSLLELSRLADNYQPMIQRCSKINDLLGLASAVLSQQSQKAKLLDLPTS